METPVATLYSEIVRRFPELRDRIDEDERSLPYELMRHVAEWIAGLGQQGVTADVAARVVAFTQWCESQPRGDTAKDDLMTILAVGFYERLFESSVTRSLLPKLFAKDDLTANADYLKTWVGEENYAKALDLYTPSI